LPIYAPTPNTLAAPRIICRCQTRSDGFFNFPIFVPLRCTYRGGSIKKLGRVYNLVHTKRYAGASNKAPQRHAVCMRINDQTPVPTPAALNSRPIPGTGLELQAANLLHNLRCCFFHPHPTLPSAITQQLLMVVRHALSSPFFPGLAMKVMRTLCRIPILNSLVMQVQPTPDFSSTRTFQGYAICELSPWVHCLSWRHSSWVQRAKSSITNASSHSSVIELCTKFNLLVSRCHRLVSR